MSKHCCEAFAENAVAMQSVSPMAGLYPPRMRSNAQFEQSDDGTWNINGCCGGGCYVVSDVRFCPFCGADVVKGD